MGNFLFRRLNDILRETMSLENQKYDVKSQELTLKGRGEKLFERIEKKIRILKTIWEITASLPVPQRSDSEEVVLEEKNQFDRLLKQAWESFPEAKTLYLRYQTLELLTEEYLLALQISFERERDLPQDEKMEKLLSEMDEIFRNDDVRFLLTIEKGVKAALEKRERIRALFQKLGEKYLSPRVYQEIALPHKNPRFREHEIIAVQPERFSVTLVLSKCVSRKGNISKPKEAKNKPGVLGLKYGEHKTDSLFNFVDADMILLNALVGGRIGSEEVRSHEDFHSLNEEFPGQGSSYEYLMPRILRIIKNTLKLQRLKAPDPIINGSINGLKLLIANLPAAYQGEFLADLVMSEERTRVGSRVFNLMQRTELEILKGLKKFPRFREIVETELQSLNFSELPKKVDNLYRTVQEKNPKKIRDLDIAFALFPLTKIRHIERLVSQWTSGSPNPQT